jgi:hypothetical protein
MTPADEYRNLAADSRAGADKEERPHIRAQWDHLAHCYERLADQAERNHRTARTHEPILHSSDA